MPTVPDRAKPRTPAGMKEIKVRFTVEQCREIAAAAKPEGLTLSAYIRRATLRQAARDKAGDV